MAEFLESKLRKTDPQNMVEDVTKDLQFTFVHNGSQCRCFWLGGNIMWVGPNEIKADVKRIFGKLNTLVESIRVIADETMAEIVCKYIKMQVKIKQELEEGAVYEATDVRPVDLKWKSLRQQSMMEVLSELSDKARAAGLDEFTITNEMIDERLAQKKRERAIAEKS